MAERLAERFHVVAHDVRGAGRSDAAWTTDGYHWRHLVADIAAVADAASPDRPVHLVGHDWGSIQSWDALGAPALVGRLASYTSISGPSLTHVAARFASPRLAWRALPAVPRSWYILVFQVPGLAPLAWRTIVGRRWRHLLTRSDPSVQVDAAWPEATVARDAARGVGLYRANIGSRRARRLGRPAGPPTTGDLPVQVVVPGGDPFVSPVYASGLERWVPRLWRRTVEGGHWIIRSRPDDVAEWIAELVDHVEGGPEAPALREARVGTGSARRLARVARAGQDRASRVVGRRGRRVDQPRVEERA